MAMRKDNIVSFASHARRPDPCAKAAARLAAAGNNDAVYDKAAADVARLPATTMAGIRAKWDALCGLIEHIEGGGELLPDGIADLRMLRETLSVALSPESRRKAG